MMGAEKEEEKKPDIIEGDTPKPEGEAPP